MTMKDLEPTWEEVAYCAPSVCFGGDFWKEDFNGVPHRLMASYVGGPWAVKVPERVPLKYKGRKLKGLVIWLDACENVTGVEATYTGYCKRTFRVEDLQP